MRSWPHHSLSSNQKRF